MAIISLIPDEEIDAAKRACRNGDWGLENADCATQHSMTKLLARIRGIEREHGRKVSLVGWSLGGAMARVLATLEPKRVRSVVTLGSPLGGHPKATNAWRLFELVSGVRADESLRLPRI